MMMRIIKKIFETRNLIWLILLYGLILTVSDLDYMSVFVDEAYHINIGQQILHGSPCPGCPFATGYVFIHPVLAAVGDTIGGLQGARMVNVILGLFLVWFVYWTGRTLFGESTGVISAALLMFSGQTLYLMKLATYDIAAAFFLGGSLMMFATSFKSDSSKTRAVALIAAMIMLFIASITKYLLPVFVPFMVLYAIYRHRFSGAMIFSLLLTAAAAALFWFYAPYSPMHEVLGQVQDVQSDSHVSFYTLADWTLRWVALAYLLAVFGMLHEKHGRMALILFVMSLPIILVHLITGAEQSVNKNVFYALIFLAPAAALGVERIGNVFSMNSPSGGLRMFFVIAVIVVFWAYGMHNFLWLQKQYPDVGPMIEYFDKNGFDGMTVVLNGWDSDIYRYSLGDKFPNAEYFHITEATKENEDGNYVHGEADFILCEDDYYGKTYPCDKYGEYLEDYQLLEHFMFEMSWGRTDARIFGRR